MRFSSNRFKTMGNTVDISNFAQLRTSLDLLLRAQQFGKTGYVISDLRENRVYWSDSLFEQRKIPRRPYFTRDEAMNFIHPDDRAAYVEMRERAIADRRDFQLEMRVLCGDGSTIWEKGLTQLQFDSDGACTALLTVLTDISESKNTAASLKIQEATYRTLFNGIGDAIFLLLDGRLVDCNDVALAMFRGTREQLVGGSPSQFSPEFQPDGRLSSEESQVKTAGALRGERQFFEWRFARFDGSEFDSEVTLTQVEAAGRPYFFAVIRDISERKVAETALKASHDKFKGAFSSSADAMLVGKIGTLTGGGEILDANEAARNIFGRRLEDLIGKTIAETRVITDFDALHEIRRRLSEGKILRNFPMTLRRLDGVSVDVEISGSTFDSGDEPLWIVVLRDVTESNVAKQRIHQLNDSLQASLRQLRAIADNLPVAISYQDTQGRFQFVNRTLEDWFAADTDEMIGKTIHDFVSEEYLAASQAARDRRAAGQFRTETTLTYPDGNTRSVEATYIPDRGDDGTIRGHYSLVVDLTVYKAAQDQLRQSQKMQAIGKLTGGVAHDFNNLLAVISGNIEMANEALAGDESGIQGLLETAGRAAERGSSLTRSLLAFSRQQPLSPQISDLNELARDTTELLRRTLPSNIEIQFVGGFGLWSAEVDPGQLQNALLNLVVNARDAMPDGGRLTIETRNARVDDDYAAVYEELLPGQYVMLAVSDTGMGMPPDVMARVFEPFFTTKANGQGTGLGLSMVYGFAKQSGGHVAIYSEVGSGTSVKLYLPRWSGTSQETISRASSRAPGDESEQVLVVEDDEDMRFIAATMLRSLGYTVLEAPNGLEALEILTRHEGIVLLLTDVMLGDAMNGRRLAEAIKLQRPEIKVLYMSGYTEDAILHHGRLDQGVHFIQKPFRKQDLARKMRETLDS
ncbi:MAG: PAS domain S-box protein [Rhizomicrobium sp.]